MIIFDYGQTLVDEKSFDPFKGTEAVLREAARNPNQVSIAEIQALAIELNKDIGRYGTDFEKQSLIEVHNFAFQNYLYEYFGIEFTKTPEEVERIFWQAASAAEPTKNIDKFLKFLDDQQIRASVISNISFSGRMLTERINRYIPSRQFEFIIASSEYVFRKPHKRIFELALRKANLKPGEVWYCGDNAVCDVDGAEACGIFAVWYKGAIDKANQYVPKRDCLAVNDWDELLEVLTGK
jgi:putative hydrolase of the HAD superfamily